MKKICFVNYDMTVTGGVEQVTTTLANEFCKEYEVYIYAIFGKGGHVPYSRGRLSLCVTEIFWLVRQPAPERQPSWYRGS